MPSTTTATTTTAEPSKLSPPQAKPSIPSTLPPVSKSPPLKQDPKVKPAPPPEPEKAPKEAPKLEKDSPSPADAPKSDAVDIIDMETFSQLLELDEDDTHDFSRGMADAYFVQAVQTFTDMDKALDEKNLKDLSSLGHFLKGSSAALGVSKVQASCEKIQHYGLLHDDETGKDLKEPEALSMITSLRTQVKEEYDIAEKWLKDWYEKNAIDESVAPDAKPEL